jgi:hypothetical protein
MFPNISLKGMSKNAEKKTLTALQMNWDYAWIWHILTSKNPPGGEVPRGDGEGILGMVVTGGESHITHHIDFIFELFNQI